ncbi:MAG: hypothetical protein Crog4KO_31270 [Crocinitomicaceae bacterium]
MLYFAPLWFLSYTNAILVVVPKLQNFPVNRIFAQNASMKLQIVSPETNPKEVQRLYEIMIHGYRVTEVDIWGEDYSRMFPEEFQEIIDRKELIGAWIADVPVGSIHTYRLNENTFAFGLFSVDFNFKGQNIGRKLIEAAEELAKERGATFMELEILRLRDKELTAKRQLHDWYVRLGYELISTTDFVDRKPDKAEKASNFIAPSVFDCYRKRLK